MEIKVSVDFDVNSFLPTLAALEKESPEWVAEFLLEKINQGFDLQGDPYDNPWAPLAKSTVEARERRGRRGIQILEETGEMRSSLRTERFAGGIRLVMDGPAAYHQRGTRHLPARKIFPEDGGRVDLPVSWQRQLEDFVGKKLAVLFSE